MLKYCPNCEQEQEVDYGICSECGEEVHLRSRKVDIDVFEDEDEFTESYWGEDLESTEEF